MEIKEILNKILEENNNFEDLIKNTIEKNIKKVLLIA